MAVERQGTEGVGDGRAPAGWIGRRAVVAIDGPAGVGKSTTARAVAAALGYTLVDTGALYRGIALAALERGISFDDAPALGALARHLDLALVPGPDGVHLHLDGVDREVAIRRPEISEAASAVSRHADVRNALLTVQRRLGANGGVVLEGRDIGTVVFPAAEAKVFLTASDEERARRRVRDLAARGMDTDYASTLEAIRGRDHRDSTRDIAPLRKAADALEIDSTDLGFDDVVARIVEWVTSRANP